MKEFKFPANIRQIGSIDDGLKIYVEDYVISYLKQYFGTGDYEEKLAILMGKEMAIDGQDVLFISGAVEGKYAQEKDGILQFTDKTWEYVLTQKEGYFDELKVVGFAQTQPSYGTYLNSSYAEYHLNTFKKPYHVLFVWDPIENLNAFYRYNDKQNELSEASGYFVYYDKNKSMHEYMMQNRTAKKAALKNEDKTLAYLAKTRPEPKAETSWDPDSFEEKRKKVFNFRRTKKTKAVLTEEAEGEIKTAKIEIAESPRRQGAEQRRVINLLVGLSAVLFILTFVMGMGLIRNEDRITSLESNLKILSTSYRNLLATVRDADVDVFAGDAEALDIDGADLLNEASENEAGKEAEKEAVNLLEASPNQAEEPEPLNEPDEVAPIETPPAQIGYEPGTEMVINELPEYYIVQSGDSLLAISKKFYGATNMMDDIIELNKIKDPNSIISGTRLVLPKRE